MRKTGLLWMCLLAISGCRREPDFDQRYDAANRKMRNMAEQIDAQIAGTGTPTPGVLEEKR